MLQFILNHVYVTHSSLKITVFDREKPNSWVGLFFFILILFHLLQAIRLAFTRSSCFEHSFKGIFSVVFSILSSLSSFWTWALQVFSYWFYATFLNLSLRMCLSFNLLYRFLLISKPIKNFLILNGSLPFFFLIKTNKQTKQKNVILLSDFSFISLAFSLSLFCMVFSFQVSRHWKIPILSLKYISLKSLLLYSYAQLPFLFSYKNNTVMITPSQGFSQLYFNKQVS